MSLPKLNVRTALLVAFGLLLLALFLYSLYDRDFFLRAWLLGAAPFAWDEFFAFLARYGYWLLIGYAIFTGAVLFIENRNPDRTLIWLLILAILPVVGLLLYWIMGPNFRYYADKRRFRRRPRFHAMVPVEHGESPAIETIRLLYAVGGARIVRTTEAVVLQDGERAFPEILKALAGARRSILVESYIIQNDSLGNEVRKLLIERARAGVQVCVLYDAVGCWSIGRSYIRSLRENGVQVHSFLPVAFPMLRGANYRNHRKIIVVDGHTAFTGGMNIGEDYLGRNKKMGYWRDTQLMIRGEAAQTLREIFFSDLDVCKVAEDVCQKLRKASEFKQVVPPDPDQGVILQIVQSGPDTAWDTINKAYFSMICRARHRLWLTTPYLVPDGAMNQALCTAALSGVDVRIMIPGKSDHVLAHWASMNACESLLRAGIRVFLYRRDRFIHSKTITCDGVIMSVGSANFDPRSLLINFEVQAFLYDRELAIQGEAAFLEDMKNAHELSFAVWEKRPLRQKIRENIGKLISPLA